MVGYSRDSFYRFKLHDKGGDLALQEISRKKSGDQERVAEEIDAAIVEVAIEQPAFGQVRIANETGAYLSKPSSNSSNCLVCPAL